MAYNPLHKLLDNIEAIRLALDFKNGKLLDSSDADTLEKYSGFGGIKEIVYPFADKQTWIDNKATEEDFRLYPKMMELHQMLHDNFKEEAYTAIIKSLKNSILTA